MQNLVFDVNSLNFWWHRREAKREDKTRVRMGEEAAIQQEKYLLGGREIQTWRLRETWRM